MHDQPIIIVLKWESFEFCANCKVFSMKINLGMTFHESFLREILTSYIEQ